MVTSGISMADEPLWSGRSRVSIFDNRHAVAEQAAASVSELDRHSLRVSLRQKVDPVSAGTSAWGTWHMVQT